MTRSRETGDVGYRAYKKNYLINSSFQEWQRGTAFTLPAGNTYTSDRWLARGTSGTGGSTNINRLGISANGYTYRILPVGHTGTFYMEQRIEVGTVGTARFSDTELTFSVFAGSSAAPMVATVNMFLSTTADGTTQIGSASLGTLVNGEQIAATIQTINLDAFTNDEDAYIIVRLNFDDVFVDGNYNLRWMQLEEGTSATSFEYVSPAENLAACQRYYQVIDGLDFTFPTNGQANFFSHTVQHIVSMRTIPQDAGWDFTVTSGGATLGVTSLVTSAISTRITIQTNTVDVNRAGYTAGKQQLDAEL